MGGRAALGWGGDGGGRAALRALWSRRMWLCELRAAPAWSWAGWAMDVTAAA